MKLGLTYKQIRKLKDAADALSEYDIDDYAVLVARDAGGDMDFYKRDELAHKLAWQLLVAYRVLESVERGIVTVNHSELEALVVTLCTAEVSNNNGDCPMCLLYNKLSDLLNN